MGKIHNMTLVRTFSGNNIQSQCYPVLVQSSLNWPVLPYSLPWLNKETRHREYINVLINGVSDRLTVLHNTTPAAIRHTADHALHTLPAGRGGPEEFPETRIIQLSHWSRALPFWNIIMMLLLLPALLYHEEPAQCTKSPLLGAFLAFCWLILYGKGKLASMPGKYLL